MRRQPRTGPATLVLATGLLIATYAPCQSQDAFPVRIDVDAGSDLGELREIWRFYGADEPNYAYMPHGARLIGELGELRPGRIFFRAHNLSWGEAGFDVRVSKFREFILEATGNTALFVPDGDFDHDGQLTPPDIDILSVEARSPLYEEGFDLDLDGRVSQEDRRIWVEELAATFFGDANLDQAVQFDDLVTLANAFGAEGGWAMGDFSGDGIVQFQQESVTHVCKVRHQLLSARTALGPSDRSAEQELSENDSFLEKLGRPLNATRGS